jgi:aryl-alcohol dehydrogenase-like predicted oxidoreductase
MKQIWFANKKLSKIALGTGRFGTRVEESYAFQLLDYFYENGGTTIDTARNYYEWVEDGRGKSEQCIGKWMEKRGNRKEMFLCTKGGVKNKGKVFTPDLSKRALDTELKESLEALRTEEIDVYLLHRDEPERSVEEIVETCQGLREYGKIGAIGVSNWKLKRLMQANAYAKKHHLEPFRVYQTWWSLAEYTDAMWNDATTTHMDDAIYAYMKEHEMLGMAYTSQCKGFFQKGMAYGVENLDPFLLERIATPVNLKKLEFIKEYCEHHGTTATAVVNGYITSNELSGVALVSVSTMAQLEDIIKTSDYELNTQIIKRIDGIK